LKIACKNDAAKIMFLCLLDAVVKLWMSEM
jgi:hypothetical protein